MERTGNGTESRTGAGDVSFEEAFAQLEGIVRRLESGETKLEDSLRLFETGVRLARICTERLDAAEARIDVLLERDGEQAVEPFEPARKGEAS